MKTSKLLLTSLLAAAAALSVPAYAEVTPIDTETYNSAADDVTVSGSVDTLNVAGAGNVTVAGDLAPKTEGGAVAVVLKNSGGLTFSLAEGETAETGRSYTVGTISTETDTGKNTRFLTVDAGVTVNATSLNNAWGVNALTVNGVLNVSGTFKFATGTGCDNIVSGTGTISAGTFDFANVGNYTLTDVTLNVGTGGIVHTTTTSHTLNLGNVSIVASAGDFTFANSNNETAKLTDDSTGTTFDTNGHVITVNQALSGTGKLKKVGEGTLKISGNNTYSGGTLIEAGTLELTSTGSLTGNVEVAGGSFTVSGTLNLSSAVTVAETASVSVSNTAVFVLSDSLKIGDTGNTYSLISGNTSGIAGWDTLTASNFRIGSGPNSLRGASADVSTAGQVDFTAGAAANLTWKGGASGTWDVQTTQNWTNDSTSADDVFYDYDNVTFATSGAVEVTVASTGVTAGTVKITAGTVTLSGGKVKAQDGFFVGDGVSEDDSTAKLVLSSNNALCGDVTVNKGGTFDLNAQSDSMSSDAINPNRIGKIVLNGGSLTSTGGSQGTNACQIYNLEVTADSKIIGGGTFGLLGREYAATTLDLGANTLTKSGGGSFVLVRTTISGNGGVLDVTQGKILGHGSYALTLGEGVTLKTSGTGGATDIKIASMATNSKLILGGSTASTVALNSFALGTGAVIDVSGANAVTGTLTSMGAGSSLTLAGTGSSNVTLSANGTAISGNITIGAGSTVTVAQDKAEVFNYNQAGITITLNGGVLDLGNKRQTIGSGTTITLNGGTIKATDGNTTGDGYGSLDLMGTHTIEVSENSEIAASMRLRNDTTFQVAADKTLTLSGIIDPKGNDDKGTTSSAIIKTGSGTLVLSGNNSGAANAGKSYDDATQLKAGTIQVEHNNALGTGALDALGDTDVNEVTLKVAEDSSGNALTIGNAISVSSGKTLILQSENTGNKLAGVISGAGSLKATYSTYTDEALTLAGDNIFSGGLEVAGVKVSAEHANALGSGMIKISDASVTYEAIGYTVTYSGSVNAATTDVVLHDVSLLANNSAQLTAETDCSFTVAEGATLYLDIGALGDDVLTGDSVALKIAGSNVIGQDDFFDTVLVGSWNDDSWIASSSWEWDNSWDASTGTLSLISVPEPSAFGLLAGAGALALVAARRRRTKRA